MTRDEIKEMYSMRDIIGRYGLYPNHAGMIQCPFHRGDRTPSLKVYAKDYHCFACGAHGDIFKFVQNMDGLSFKDAFESLGGTYEHKKQVNFELYHAEKRREMKLKAQVKEERERKLNGDLISIYRAWIQRLEPFSPAWCDCQNALVIQIGELEERGAHGNSKA